MSACETTARASAPLKAAPVSWPRATEEKTMGQLLQLRAKPAVRVGYFTVANAAFLEAIARGRGMRSVEEFVAGWEHKHSHRLTWSIVEDMRVVSEGIEAGLFLNRAVEGSVKGLRSMSDAVRLATGRTARNGYISEGIKNLALAIRTIMERAQDPAKAKTGSRPRMRKSPREGVAAQLKSEELT
jgi:hypothetical protein